MEPANIRLPGWTIGKELGKGGYGSVYQISRDVFGKVEHNALKVINLPQEQGQIEFMRLSGMNDASIIAHMQSQVKSFMDEYSIMQVLQDNPNIVHCYDFQHTQHKDKFSWTILIRMELLTPLLKAMDKISTEEQIIKLGLDMCSALIACQEHNIIHRDIKPQNIFVAKNGSFKLGDFGISKILDNTANAHTKAGTLLFIAPEVVAGQPYNATVDIYSLGLMLYWLLNHCRGPFLPLPPQAPSFGQDQEAIARRLKGDSFPPPAKGSNGLKQIVMKACSFRPADRYQSAREMQQALRALKAKPDDGIHQTPKASAYVVSAFRTTGTNSYFFFRDLERIATVNQPVLSDFSLEIKGKTLQLSNSTPRNLSSLPPVRELLTDDGKVFASVSGHKNGTSTIICQDRLYTVSIVETGWEIRSNNKSVATITDLKKVPPKWTVQQNFLYNNPMMGFSGTYQMQTDSAISDELALVFLSYPLLEYPAPEAKQIHTVTRPTGHNYVMLQQFPLEEELKFYYERDNQHIADARYNFSGLRLILQGKTLQQKKLPDRTELRWNNGQLFAVVTDHKNGNGTVTYRGKQYSVTFGNDIWTFSLLGTPLVRVRDMDPRGSHLQELPPGFPTYHSSAVYQTLQPADIPDELAILFLSYPLLIYSPPAQQGNSASGSGLRIDDSLPSQYSLVPLSGTGDTCSYVYLQNHNNFASVRQSAKEGSLNIRINQKKPDGMFSQKEFLSSSPEYGNPEAKNLRILRRPDGSIYATVSGLKNGKSCIHYGGRSKYVLSACSNGWLIHIGDQHLGSLRTERPASMDPGGPNIYHLHSSNGFPRELALLLLTYPLLEFPAPHNAVVDTTDISQITGDRTLNPDDILVGGNVGNLAAVEILLKAKNIRTAKDLGNCDRDTMNDLVRAVQQSVSSMPFLAAAELLHYRMKYGEFPLYYDEQIKLRRHEMYPIIAYDSHQSFPCRINDGRTADLIGPMEKLPADLMDLRVCQSFQDAVANAAHLNDTGDVMDLACRILATGEVPTVFRTRNQKASIPDDVSKKNFLDIYGTLELKYQPRGKDRKQVVLAEGKKIEVTLPSKLFNSEPEDIVVQNAGHTDPVTGQTGDAHIMVSCKGLFYRPNSLINILLNIFLLIAVVVFGAFQVVKAIVTTKLFRIAAVIGILVYVVQRFFLN